MPLIRGRNLSEIYELLRRGAEGWTLPRTIGVLHRVCETVAYAHSRGVVHRDLKPANVLVSLEDDGLIPKIADFGLVKDVAGGSDTRTGSMMGTPNYMSPEQIRDTKSVDHRTDLFALGAILYELVTQRLAFSGDDVLDIFNRIDRGQYTPASELRPDIPERMIAAIEGALAGE